MFTLIVECLLNKIKNWHENLTLKSLKLKRMF